MVSPVDASSMKKVPESFDDHDRHSGVNYTSSATPEIELQPLLTNSTNTSIPPASTGTSDMLTNMMAVCFCLSILLCCCRRRTPGPEHWRGAELRRRHLERLARQRARDERENQTPEHRHCLFKHNMRTKRVVAKDDEGSWTLGHIASPDSTDTISSTDSTAQGYNHDEDDNEDEHACVICLDSFQVGDIVSWSRFSNDCHHVFHEECIRPWLEGKRQDECPSCRNQLMLEEPDLEQGQLKIGEGVTGCFENEEKPLGEEYDDREDSFFVIVHGLIFRAAKHATYSLIGSKDSQDEPSTNNKRLPPASPLRRVVSHEPTPSPPTLIVGGMRRSAAPLPFDRVSLHDLFGTAAGNRTKLTFGKHADIISSTRSVEGDTDDEDVIVGLQTTAVAATATSTSDDSITTFPFRRVKSDVAGSPAAARFRNYPMRRHCVDMPSNITPCSSNDSRESSPSLPPVVPPDIRRQSSNVFTFQDSITQTDNRDEATNHKNPALSSHDDHTVDVAACDDDEENRLDVATEPHSSSPMTTTTSAVVFGDVETHDVNKL